MFPTQLGGQLATAETLVVLATIWPRCMVNRYCGGTFLSAHASSMCISVPHSQNHIPEMSNTRAQSRDHVICMHNLQTLNFVCLPETDDLLCLEDILDKRHLPP